MRSFVEPIRSRAVSRLTLLALMSVGVAGCSSDFSRFNQNPYASRPTPANNEVTGSVPAQRAPTPRVESAALPPPPSQPSQPTYGGSAGMGSYNPAPSSGGDVTGSISPPPPRQPAPTYTWEGGTAVTVRQGETIETISRRHNVPVSAIMQANNLHGPALIQPGQRLVIPRQNGSAPVAQTPAVQAPQTRVAGPAYAPPAAAPSAGNTVHTVQPGETLFSLSRRYHKQPMAIARANNVGLDHKVRIGDRVVIPGGAPTMQAAAPAATAPAAARSAPQAQQPQAAPAPQPQQQQRVTAVKTEPVVKPQPMVSSSASKVAATNEPAATARVVTPAADPAPETSAPTGSTGSTSFRWPARGRVIQGFGPKGNGQQNDGINIAVPEGTAIKAAEDGVVAYSGSELKGYGNLVLVRHANGYVTAYAHASELNVKKGESVKRGQVIGKSGSTGNVNSPQLHFEIRKGATPVDPNQYLAGG